MPEQTLECWCCGHRVSLPDLGATRAALEARQVGRDERWSADDQHAMLQPLPSPRERSKPIGCLACGGVYNAVDGLAHRPPMERLALHQGDCAICQAAGALGACPEGVELNDAIPADVRAALDRFMLRLADRMGGATQQFVADHWVPNSAEPAPAAPSQPMRMQFLICDVCTPPRPAVDWTFRRLRSGGICTFCQADGPEWLASTTPAALARFKESRHD